MNEFIDSTTGKKLIYFNGLSKTLFFDVSQEPQSKDSITLEEKKYFQKCIKEVMLKRRRRPFRGQVVLEITFNIPNKNPPSIHRLAKNYIDLLVDDVQYKNRKVLLNDDRQISLLSVKCDYDLTKDHRISLKICSYAHFTHGVDLVDHLYFGDIEDADFSQENVDKFKEREADEKRELSNRTENLIEGLEELVVIKDVLEEKKRRYLQLLNKRMFQSAMLEQNSLDTHDVLSMFFNDLFKKRGLQTLEIPILSPRFTLELPDVPQKEGDSKYFKKALNECLFSYKKNQKAMFPMLCPIGITILYCPPKNHYIDLDNLASKIVPLVHEIFKPNFAFWGFVSESSMGSLELEKICKNEKAKYKQAQKVSIRHYQVIKLSRDNARDENGFVLMLLENGELHQTVWEKIEIAVRKML